MSMSQRPVAVAQLCRGGMTATVRTLRSVNPDTGADGFVVSAKLPGREAVYWEATSDDAATTHDAAVRLAVVLLSADQPPPSRVAANRVFSGRSSS